MRALMRLDVLGSVVSGVRPLLPWCSRRRCAVCVCGGAGLLLALAHNGHALRLRRPLAVLLAHGAQPLRAPVVDVRAPCEFARGAIPHAVSLPLLTDNVRDAVGKAWAAGGRSSAVLLGIEAAAASGALRGFADGLEHLLSSAPAATPAAAAPRVLFCCARGGLRSRSAAFFAEALGCGPCAAFRQRVLARLAAPLPAPVVLLAGRTGTGKTEVLTRLAARQPARCFCVDLERCARHRGSAFGRLPGTPPATQEMFENRLALRLEAAAAAVAASACRPGVPPPPLLFEAEDRRVGNCLLPARLWEHMGRAPLVVLEVPFDARVRRLVREYELPTDEACAAIRAIGKRLGPALCARILDEAGRRNLEGTCRCLLEQYYDPLYDRGILRRAAHSQGDSGTRGDGAHVQSSGSVDDALLAQVEAAVVRAAAAGDAGVQESEMAPESETEVSPEENCGWTASAAAAAAAAGAGVGV